MLTPKAIQPFLLLVVALYGAFLMIVYVDWFGLLQIHSSSSPTSPQLTTLPLGVRLQHSRSLPLRLESTQPTLYLQTEGVKINDLTDVTVMIKTMDRPACVRKLIFDIHEHHPNLTILVADDGEFPSWTEDDDGPYVKYFRMPYDSGLSAGRNLMLSQVQTPYVLLLDDDFLWDIAVLHDFIYVMELHPYLDIVGGRAGLHFAGFLKVHNQTLFLVKGEHGILEGTDVINGVRGRPCEVVDFVPNFFLARTETLMNLQWHNSLKIGEHEEFFMRFNYARYKAAFCPDITVVNQQSKCAEVHASAAVAERKRTTNRGRARMFIKQGLNMHKLKRIAYCLGDGFVAPSWDRIHDLPGHDCYEVPLPEDCPPGWTGEKCETCMPNHFGPHCKPCDCEHGTCNLQPETSTIFCVCEIGWIGEKCSEMVAFSADLIKDPLFASLEDPESEKWKQFQDGCVSVAPDGLWLVNDGQLACGAGIQVALDQTEVRTIRVGGSSMSVGVKAPLENPAAYSLYFDFAFTDNTTQEGLFLPFSPNTTLQSREVLMNPEKPVKTMSLYVVLRNVYGSAFFQNVTVQIQAPP